MSRNDPREQTIRLAKSTASHRRRIVNLMTWQDVVEAEAEYERWLHDA